jgi:hypothetical protein
MNDPHVDSLTYRLEVPVTGSASVSFDRAPPADFDTPVGRVHVGNQVAHVTPAEHFRTDEEARTATEPFLRAWELSSALALGRPAMRFVFDGATVIDRDPTPGQGEARLVGVAHMTADASLLVQPAAYPAPPADFEVSPLVEAMWLQYQGHLEGRERLTAMAYLCLTLLEDDAGGGHKKTAAKFGIHPGVLDYLGYLVSVVGDVRTARKWKGLREKRPHTGEEEEWIRRVVSAIIRRAGEVAANPSAGRTVLTMSDLPRLSNYPRQRTPKT